MALSFGSAADDNWPSTVPWPATNRAVLEAEIQAL
jgi:hypothetical protein